MKHRLVCELLTYLTRTGSRTDLLLPKLKKTSHNRQFTETITTLTKQLLNKAEQSVTQMQSTHINVAQIDYLTGHT